MGGRNAALTLNNMGEKELEGKVSFEEIDPAFIALIAKRLNVNKDKYPVGNWKKPMNIYNLLDALQRHVVDLRMLLDGREPIYNKDETAQDHCAAIAANCQFINWQITTHHV